MSKPGFIKRLLVIIYDGLLLLGAVLFSSLLLMAVFNFLAPDSFYQAQPIDGQLSTFEHSDLGRLYLVKEDGKFINWRQALVRYVCALLSWVALGLGFIWILFSAEKRAWHDSLSGSMIVFSKQTNGTSLQGSGQQADR